MRDGQQKLTRKQYTVLAALLSEPTIEKAAKQSGVSAPTIYRWLKDVEFRQEYVAAKWQVVQQTIGRLQLASSLAVNTLQDVMKDPEAPTACKVSSAKIVLEMTLKGVEIEDLEMRLTLLEKRQKDDDPFYAFSAMTP